jgi:hypothetical protein
VEETIDVTIDVSLPRTASILPAIPATSVPTTCDGTTRKIFAALSPQAFLDTFTFGGSREWFPDSQETLFIGFSRYLFY